MSKQHLAYMCAPVRGNVDHNLLVAERWFRELRAVTLGLPLTIIGPWITSMRVGGDTDSEETRKRGLLDDCTVVVRCDGIIAVGEAVVPSSGMSDEIAVCPGWYLNLLPLTSRLKLHEETPSFVLQAMRAAIAAVIGCAP